MCELLAMSARFPTNLRLSFDELARHGGETGPHADGWGLALWHDGDASILREPDAASRSPWVEFLREREPKTSIALAHVRRATQGPRALRNTQPLARELGGRLHVFAHNGMLPGIEADPRFVLHRFGRIGDTDSEYACCALLERLAPLWASGIPPLADRLRVVRAFAAELRSLGPANFIYTDGDVILAHAHRRRDESGEIRPPGLHLLCRTCSMAPSEVPELTGVAIDREERQHVALIASVPLSKEHWEPLAEGELVVLRDGRVIERIAPSGEVASAA